MAGESETASWRSELAKVDVWYASFGSNMWKPRFLCYIQGGQAAGMKKACVGAMDKTPPKETTWRTFPNRLFFGRESTVTWGKGGSAFLNPLTSPSDQSHMCFYRITLSVVCYDHSFKLNLQFLLTTLEIISLSFFFLFFLLFCLKNRLEQFNDVLFQENGMKVDSETPLFDLSALQLVQNNGSIPLAKSGWYGNVVCVGKESGIPILTMTCTLSVLEKFISGEVPLRPPAKAYANSLVMGLVEGGRLSEEEAWAYIDNAASKPL